MSTAYDPRSPALSADDPGDAPANDYVTDLMLALETTNILEQAAATFDDPPGDFRVLSTELLSRETHVCCGRECPVIDVTLSVQFKPLDDSVAEIHRQLAARLHHLAERIERRAECEGE